MNLREPLPTSPVIEELRTVTLFGHAYMADVEPGRQRLRVKLPNDLDATLELPPDQVAQAPNILDHTVRVDVEETLRNGQIVRRFVREIRLLQLVEEGPDRPAKSVVDLAREQGVVLRGVPDYVALASEVWPTIDDVERFERYVRESRLAAR